MRATIFCRLLSTTPCFSLAPRAYWTFSTP
jgi:hypothetical protein